MRTAPTGWAAIYEAPHRTSYKFVINGVEYLPTDYVDTPVIKQPLMEEPSFGRCCTGSLEITVRKKENVTIPKAASVVAYCRIENNDAYTDWVDIGYFNVSKRVNYSETISLTCNDRMIFAGQTYLDKTEFTEWPQAMTDVLDEIASIMDVDIDERTTIRTDSSCYVAYPNEDVLMSEILASIAAAHGGSFVMTGEGKLRLIPFPDTTTSGMYFYDLDKYDISYFAIWNELRAAYVSYSQISNAQKTVSRVTLSDSADNIFTSGSDTGIELAAVCEYATQAMCNTVGNLLIGRSFIPYELSGAYFNPLIELGDSFSIRYRGEQVILIANNIELSCTYGYSCSVSNRMQEDDEEEVPYISTSELKAKRYVSTTKAYRGNRINRTEGFVSEYMVNDEPVARLLANSDVFAMQRIEDGEWQDCIYFDAVNRQYTIAGNVHIDTSTLDISVVSLSSYGFNLVADSSGKVSATSVVIYVVAVTGNRAVTPTITSVTGAPTGMTCMIGAAVNNRIPITISIANNATLGGTGSTRGTLSINVTTPVAQSLEVSWAKINTGRNGTDGSVTYAQATQPTENVNLGDIWIDTSDNNKMYRYNGESFDPVQDENITRLDQTVTQQSAALEVINGQISTFVSETDLNAALESTVSSMSSQINQTAQDLTINFQGQITSATGAVDSKYNTLIRASGDGVEIGKTGSSVKALLANNQLSFIQSGDVVAYFGNKKMYIKDAQATNSLIIGGASEQTSFVWKKNSTGLILTYTST